MILDKYLTVKELARRHGKNPSRIRQIALAHDIGTCLNNQFRIFTKEEAAEIDRIIAETGRCSQKSTKSRKRA